MRLIAKTYRGGAPMHFRRPPRDAAAEPVLLRAEDGRELAGLRWTPAAQPRPRVAVLCMHPRVDFSRHYTFPGLLGAGIACLGASTRHPNNDTATVHEELLLDVAACVRHLREHGAERVILLGNSGGGPLFGFYQEQARLAPAARVAATPGGAPTRLPHADLPPADALMLIACHKGEGRIMNECIDPSVVDERDPLRSDPELDMYDPRNGFREPPAWSEYDEAFVRRYRAAQLERVRRLDAVARAWIALGRDAAARRRAPDWDALPPAERRRLLRTEALQPVMVVYRTMANLHYVDRHLDPSGREYGSLLSDRPDLMNLQLLGFGRVCTPHAWLSTWSGLSSNADLVRALRGVAEPTLVVQAGRDREIFPRTDGAEIFAAAAAADRTFHELPEARHYFEPDFGSDDESQRERLCALIVPWIRERFGT